MDNPSTSTVLPDGLIKMNCDVYVFRPRNGSDVPNTNHPRCVESEIVDVRGTQVLFARVILLFGFCASLTQEKGSQAYSNVIR